MTRDWGGVQTLRVLNKMQVPSILAGGCNPPLADDPCWMLEAYAA